ncbi:MAG: rhodanese-like domain-containing protein [Lachnospiraceae bacterium]|nr:rhodanese-like domain-containing protein [Lachnospiraceae bacterium]
MGLFDFFKKADINAGYREFRSLKRAMLVDVREPAEYKSGHLQGARNIPVDSIEKATSGIQDKDMPLFVYCLSGARARKAVSKLTKMGYTNVKSIGGINDYTGKLVK